MYSKEQSKQIKKEFWVNFGKAYPKKWLLYNTKIKGFSFKFIALQKKAGVTVDIESRDEIQRQLLFEQMESLKNILIKSYIRDVVFHKDYILDNGKTISRICVDYPHEFNIYNKELWSNCYQFFNDRMSLLEEFWEDYSDYIKQACL